MEKFLNTRFGVLLGLAILLFIVHEMGHYFAYRILGYDAKIRFSLIAPGIDPIKDIEVSRLEGVLISLGGFILSTFTVVGLSILLKYPLWLPLFLGSVGFSIADFIWCITMMFSKRIVISGKSN